MLFNKFIKVSRPLFLKGLLFFLYSLSFVSIALSQCASVINGYDYVKELTIDNTKVSGSIDLNNFNVLVSMIDADLKHTTNSGFVADINGWDILFTDVGGNLLDHQIVKYVPTTGQVIMWVEVTTVYATIDTKIMMNFGNASVATDPSTTGAWNPNYKGVWSLEEDPSNGTPQMQDGTSNSNNLTASGGMTIGDLITTKVDDGIEFDGSNDYLADVYDADFDFGTGSITIEAWVKTPGTSSTITTNFSVSIATDMDDVEENSGGGMYTNSSDLEMADDGGTTNQKIGLKFNGISIPEGATINSASIDFYAEGNNSNATNLTIVGEGADDAASFTSSNNDLTSRTTTTASVVWNSIGAWLDNNSYSSPDLSTIVQEIVSRPGWGSGNDMVFKITGSGTRRAESFEGTGGPQALLQVNYTYAESHYVVSRYDDQGFKLWVKNDGKIGFGLDDDANWQPDYTVSSSAAYDDNNWHHVVAVKYANDSIVLFVDGVRENSKTIIGACQGDVSISTSLDDVEEESGGAMYTTSSDLEMVDDGGRTDQKIGLRFNGIELPQGTVIDSAFLEFYADGNNSSTANLTIVGEDADDAVAFTTAANNLSGRTFTTASVAWAGVASWSDNNTYQSPDVKTILQEIVGRGGWTSGNDVVFKITGSGVTNEIRRAESFDGSGGPPPRLRFYVSSITMNTLSSNSASFTIGSDEPTNGGYFNGAIDEVRISDNASTEGWVATNYNTQNSPATFMSSSTKKKIYYWTGAVNNDWNNNSNWLPSKPGATDVALIPNVVNNPILSSTQSIGSLFIDAGGIFDGGSSQTLTVNSQFINGGTFTPNTGTIEYNQTDNQMVCPLTFNNVVFLNSGNKILLGNIISTGNLTISGTTNLDISTNNYSIDVEGNWSNNSNFTARKGAVNFGGAGNQTMTHNAGMESFYNVTINKSANGLLLIGVMDIVSGGTMTFIKGIVTSSDLNEVQFQDGALVSGGSTISYIDGPAFKIGNDAFTFPIGNAGYYNPLGISAPSLLTDEFRANYRSISPSNRSNLDVTLVHVSSLDLWDLDRINGASSVIVTLYWNSIDHGVTYLADLAVAHYDGTSSEWENMGGLAAGSPSAGSILSTLPLSTFSPITLASKVGINPLPIELISFNANANGDRVDLKWSTSAEINNDYFTVERSIDGKKWEEILTRAGSGNSSQIQEYYDVDYEPLEGLSYYRLKQTDYDGEYSYSNIVPVRFYSNGNGTLSIFPNPVNSGNELALAFNGVEEEEVLLVIRDVTGREFFSKVIVNIIDGNLVGLPIESVIPSGIYLITATSENQIYSQKLIVK